MNNKIKGFGIVVLVFILLAVTCPDKQVHQEKIKMTISNVIDESLVTSASESEQGFALIGSLFATKIVDINYFFFSTGQISFGGNTKMVSFGILNKVFTFDEDDIRRAISDTLDTDEDKESL